MGRLTRKPRLQDAPGHKVRKTKNGETIYWVAKQVVRDPQGFTPLTVRLHGDDDAMAQRCRVLTAELRAWLSPSVANHRVAFDGTMKGVIALYRRHPESPYHDVKANTRRMYDESLDLLEKTVGARVIGRLTGIDIKRWHGNLKKPAKAGGPERVRRAYKAMQLLRIAMTFGAVCGHEECERLSSILGKMRFEQPKRREKFVSYQQSTAIIEEALSRGLHSVALGQALQFELTLRQSEVIGSWEEDDGAGGGIVHLGRKWGDGLTWGHIDASGILNKETTKRGVKALHNVLASPVLMRLIDMVPQEKRIGPMIICETTGRPYRYRHWAGTWRKIANAVGVPADVWNRDSRAGGITEGFDAGADLETMRQHASHTDAAMTSHYNRLTVLKTEKVAKLRQAHRKKDE